MGGEHMKDRILIKNAKAIVTCDGTDQVFYDADMLIEGSVILKIRKDIHAEGCKVIDAKNKFIYPGLINTHHHFFQTFVRNMMSIDYPNMLVVDWLDKIYPIFQQVNEEVIYYSSLTAMADLIKHGCTCAFDHQYCYTSASGKYLIDRQMDAADILGIRYHAGRGTNTLPKSEGSTIPDGMLETTEEFIKDCERVIHLYHDPKPFSMRQIVVAPCQPINSYMDTFVEAVALARDKKVHLHTHLYEGDRSIIKERYGKTSLEWCRDIGFIGPDVWIAHGWEIEKDEYKFMAETGTGISHCPAPAVLGGFPILDIKSLLEEGVLVSLGVDGSATNDGTNMLDSLRMAYLMQAYHSKSRGGCVSPYDMLKVATINGAKTLGRNDIGSLEVGKAADLFMIDTNVLELTGALHEPNNILAGLGVSGNVWMTIINGKVVYENGYLTNVDEQKLAEKGEEVCTRVIREEFKAYF
jgi:hydroxyatrazine ethylaminohydrolase